MTMRRLSLGVCLLAAALAAAPASALGAANHPFLSAITGSPTGFEDACGLAFGPGGLYVSDYYHDAIVGSPGIAGEDPGDGPCKLGFDSEGNLYVNNYHRDVVKYTEPFGAPTVIDPAQPTGLTVDPATGNLYVAHRTYVAEYEAPVQAGDPPVKTIGLGPLKEAYGVAVSDFPATAGYVYVPDAKDNTVKVFTPAGSLVEIMTGAATPQGAFKYLVDAEVAIDNSPTSPSYGHLYLLDAIGHNKSEHPEAVLDEFNAAGAYRGQITGFTDAEPSGIAFQEGTHNVYVTSGNSEGSAVFVYGPTAPAHTFKVAKTGSGAGTVTSSPAGIDCGSACQAEFNEGEKVTLFAAPDAGSTFSGWTVTGAEPCPGTGTCTVLLSKNVEVSASFAPAPPAPPLPPAPSSSEGAVAAPAAVSGAPSAPAPTGAAQGQAGQAQGETHGGHRAKQRHRHRHHPHKTVTH
jgi:DNA-binding beta-propeller fold protein YncE